MRHALVLGLLLSVPTALALPPASLTPPLPSNEDALPFNAVANGGFERGLAGWVPAGYASHARPIVQPGAAASPNAYRAVNEFLHGGIYQPITAPQASGVNLVLDFYARHVALPSAARPGITKIETYTHWNMDTGDARITGSVNFVGPDLWFYVWDGPIAIVAAPADTAWHHYQLVHAGVGREIDPTIPGGLGAGVLLIDGVPQRARDGTPALAIGTPATVDPATYLYIGEGNWCDCAGGPAPDVEFDEVYFGVKV